MLPGINFFGFFSGHISGKIWTIICPNRAPDDPLFSFFRFFVFFKGIYLEKSDLEARRDVGRRNAGRGEQKRRHYLGPMRCRVSRRWLVGEGEGACRDAEPGRRVRAGRFQDATKYGLSTSFPRRQQGKRCYRNASRRYATFERHASKETPRTRKHAPGTHHAETPSRSALGEGDAVRTGPGATLGSARRHLEVREVLLGTRQIPFEEHRTEIRKIPVRNSRYTKHETATGPCETPPCGARHHAWVNNHFFLSDCNFDGTRGFFYR